MKKVISYFLILIHLSQACLASQSLSPEEYVDLYIHQKEYHSERKKNGLGIDDGPLEHSFVTRVQNIYESAEIEEIAVPAKYEGQPAIPSILYKPKGASTLNKRPVIIHVHGGPHVHMTTDRPHADIAFFLSHEFVVIAPNYRGSTGYGEEYKNSALGMHFIKGAEDVYAAALFARELDYVNKDHMILRGGSYGSCISSNLLSDIRKGKFEPIFAGVHLSGGLYYPIEMHEETPIFISHGLQDPTCSPSRAILFMQKLLNSNRHSNLQTFIAHQGDHHLISPTLQREEKEKEEYEELLNFLSLTANFAFNPSGDGKFIFESQDKQLIRLSRTPLQVSRFTSPVLNFSSSASDDEIVTSFKLARKTKRVLEQDARLVAPNFLQKFYQRPFISGDDLEKLHGPTMSYLKLVLGDSFSSNIEKSWRIFLKDHFKPIDYLPPSEERAEDMIVNAGERILADQGFLETILSATANEESYLKKNPKKTVLYHTANEDSLQAYLMMSIYRNFLNGVPADSISIMRFMDCFSNTYLDTDMLLMEMREKRRLINPDAKQYFNNLPGFQKVGIAFNSALAGNHSYTASNTLWWFFAGTVSGKTTVNLSPIATIANEILLLLGTYSKARVDRYVEFFRKEQGRSKSNGESPSVLQQIFLDADSKDAYVCDIWGEEFTGSEGREISQLSTMSKLVRDPFGFERYLAERKTAFSNPSGAKVYPGNEDSKALYTQVLQVRAILKPGQYEAQSYIRYPRSLERFMSSLMEFIKEDISCFIMSNTVIPKEIMRTNESFLRNLRKSSGVDHNKYDFSKYAKILLNTNNLQLMLQSRPELRARIFSTFISLGTFDESFTPLLNQITDTSIDELEKIYASVTIRKILSRLSSQQYLDFFNLKGSMTDENLKLLEDNYFLIYQTYNPCLELKNIFKINSFDETIIPDALSCGLLEDTSCYFNFEVINFFAARVEGDVKKIKEMLSLCSELPKIVRNDLIGCLPALFNATAEQKDKLIIELSKEPEINYQKVSQILNNLPIDPK